MAYPSQRLLSEFEDLSCLLKYLKSLKCSWKSLPKSSSLAIRSSSSANSSSVNSGCCPPARRKRGQQSYLRRWKIWKFQLKKNGNPGVPDIVQCQRSNVDKPSLSSCVVSVYWSNCLHWLALYCWQQNVFRIFLELVSIFQKTENIQLLVKNQLAVESLFMARSRNCSTAR